jgi:hypothetical protein
MTHLTIGSVERSGETISVEKLLRHPLYQHPSFMYDAMLVKLRHPSTAPLVKLNIDENLPGDRGLVTVNGYGFPVKGGPNRSDILRKVSLPIVYSQLCQQLLKPLNITINEHLQVCAGVVPGGGKDACKKF